MVTEHIRVRLNHASTESPQRELNSRLGALPLLKVRSATQTTLEDRVHKVHIELDLGRQVSAIDLKDKIFREVLFIAYNNRSGEVGRTGGLDYRDVFLSERVAVPHVGACGWPVERRAFHQQAWMPVDAGHPHHHE